MYTGQDSPGRETRPEQFAEQTTSMYLFGARNRSKVFNRCIGVYKIAAQSNQVVQFNTPIKPRAMCI